MLAISTCPKSSTEVTGCKACVSRTRGLRIKEYGLPWFCSGCQNMFATVSAVGDLHYRYAAADRLSLSDRFPRARQAVGPLLERSAT